MKKGFMKRGFKRKGFIKRGFIKRVNEEHLIKKGISIKNSMKKVLWKVLRVSWTVWRWVWRRVFYEKGFTTRVYEGGFYEERIYEQGFYEHELYKERDYEERFIIIMYSHKDMGSLFNNVTNHKWMNKEIFHQRRNFWRRVLWRKVSRRVTVHFVERQIKWTLPSTSDARPGVDDHLQLVVFDTPINFPW